MVTLASNGKPGNFSSVLDRNNLSSATTSFYLVGGTPALADNQLLDPWGASYQYRCVPVDVGRNDVDRACGCALNIGDYRDAGDRRLSVRLSARIDQCGQK